jgi:YhcH/YjgK/YiaL family protein
MIIGNLKNIDFYSDLFLKCKKGFDFVKEANLSTENKRYDLADGLYVTVFNQIPKKSSEYFFETHNEYVDIQCPLEGYDFIALKPASECKKIQIPYNKEKDITFFSDPIEKLDLNLTLKAGDFVVLFPDEAHLPGIGDIEIKKILVKIRRDLIKF